MTKSNPHDRAASVRARLQNLAKQRSEDFQFVLGRYAIERLVYRLFQSKHADRFVVKGAILFHIWTENPYRATRDIDLLAHGNNTIEHLVTVFKEVCDVPVADDGLVFQSDAIIGERIKPDQEYEGVRIQFIALLQRARIPIQVDIGFGDVITPGPAVLQFPSMLGFSTPAIATYPRETVVAEKLQAMVQLGISNSRMKDFFDLWIMSQHFEFSCEQLANAVQATFARRGTPIPDGVPFALTERFYNDVNKQNQWKAFLKNASVSVPPIHELFERLEQFLVPPIEAARDERAVYLHWPARGPWTSS